MALFPQVESLVVGAGDHAGAAADALIRIDGDDAVGPFAGRTGGADLHAGRLGAVHALERDRDAANLRIFAAFLFDHPQPDHPRRRGVFHLAHQRTAGAADALLEVDDHSVSHDAAPALATLTLPQRSWVSAAMSTLSG